MERKAWTGFGLDWMDGCSEWGLCTGGSGNQLTGEPLFPKSVDPLNLASGLESSCSSLSLHYDWFTWSCHVAIGQCPLQTSTDSPRTSRLSRAFLLSLLSTSPPYYNFHCLVSLSGKPPRGDYVTDTTIRVACRHPRYRFGLALPVHLGR
ncbi:hypothetical protein ASPBRDRAFT_453480 [Aspergillus brasiliensis CBS 101740]|uniref:Uncharacterized protein n=1 Tax=Aspergillus brasiliensis (strain CBS 101740 / IMI 381727 / IBT 21946) TaxID=767769 RepID=A0A1L9USB0_ASPBC|nr:hypothetical protein ASPBRDRAFT_453480 [Aspergillus brasiliensis CBS 101740]